MNTRQFLEHLPVSDSSRELLLAAVAKSGPNKDQLKSDAPSDNIGWQVLVGYLAPQRVKIWGMMGSVTDAYMSLDAELEALAINLPQALAATEPANRWNLMPRGYNRTAVLRELSAAFNVDPAESSQALVATLKSPEAQLVASVAPMIAAGKYPDWVWIDNSDGRLRIQVYWETTKLTVACVETVDAVLARAKKLDAQIAAANRTGFRTQSCREAQAASRWKPSARQVPLKAELAAEVMGGSQ